MSTPDPKNPFSQRLSVRLSIATERDWFSIECEICHKIAATGDVASLGRTLDEVLSRVVNLHLHEV